MPDISIVICTYNPSPLIFKRVLDSVAALIIPLNCPIECCLVDNNSQPPLNEIDYIRSFLAATPWARVVVETTQGISAARRMGVKATSAPVIVFLDDDNQPDPNYIANLADLLRQYPQVGIWGPGRVQVEFMETVDAWVEANKWIHQERDVDSVTFGREHYWTPHHPAGTGHVVRRSIMLQYNHLVDGNAISLTGRTGKSLASGEDAQIVYTAIKCGYDVGISPGLVIHHLIPKKRTQISYVKKLLYNIIASGAVANIEIFPDQKDRYYGKISSSRQILISLIRIIGSSVRARSLTMFQMHSSSYLGHLAGSYQVIRGKQPLWLSLAIRLHDLQYACIPLTELGSVN